MTREAWRLGFSAGPDNQRRAVPSMVFGISRDVAPRRPVAPQQLGDQTRRHDDGDEHGETGEDNRPPVRRREGTERAPRVRLRPAEVSLQRTRAAHFRHTPSVN
jgi:hypothetical protein